MNVSFKIMECGIMFVVIEGLMVILIFLQDVKNVFMMLVVVLFQIVQYLVILQQNQVFEQLVEWLKKDVKIELIEQVKLFKDLNVVVLVDKDGVVVQGSFGKDVVLVDSEVIKCGVVGFK